MPINPSEKKFERWSEEELYGLAEDGMGSRNAPAADHIRACYAYQSRLEADVAALKMYVEALIVPEPMYASTDWGAWYRRKEAAEAVCHSRGLL